MTTRTGQTLRRCAATLMVGASVAALSACSSGPDLDAATAKSTYDPVLREVADVTAADGKVRWTESSPSSVGATTDGCTWFSRTLASKTDLGDTPGWDQVGTSIEAVLRKHGFEAATPSELKGGYTGIGSSDERGAHLMLSSKGKTDLRIAVAVTDSC